MKPVICFEMLYAGLSIEEKIARISAHGFPFIEFWSWRDKDIKSMEKACRANNVKVANFSGQRAGNLVDASEHQLIENDLKSALESSEILGNDILMLLTQELGDEGVVVNCYENMSPAEKRANCVAGLKKLLKLLPQGKKLVLEPLNIVKDHVGYFLSDLDAAVSILDEVGDSRVKILCDFYHQGMMGDNPVELIDKYIDYIGYVHIADYPGRHEPGTSKDIWPDLIRKLKDAGYEGYVGFEFSPEGDSDKALDRTQEVWRSGMSGL